LGIQVSFNQQIAQAQTPVTPPTTAKYTCPAQLESSINTVITRPLFKKMRWGILVRSLSSPQTLYSREADKYFIPGSNTKLFTTAPPLQRLGANLRTRTSIYQDSEGVLRIIGRGDPSLKDEQLKILADVQAYYGAPVNNLILNKNAYLLTLLPQKIDQLFQIKWNNPTEAYKLTIESTAVTVQENKPNFVVVNSDFKVLTLRIKGQLAVKTKPEIIALSVFNPIDNFLINYRHNLLKKGITVK
jgi:D-alanyl-D-alanine carboxypeptidase/D-alanyl-D-alanine-endopeptidase (penicillin-binding protein 4)